MIPWDLFQNSESIVMRMRQLDLNERQQELFMNLLINGALNCTKEGLIEETVNYESLKDIQRTSASSLVLETREISEKLKGMSVEYILKVIEGKGLFTLENSVDYDKSGLFYENRFYSGQDLNDAFNLCKIIRAETKPLGSTIRIIATEKHAFHKKADEVIQDAFFENTSGYKLGYFNYFISDEARTAVESLLKDMNPLALHRIDDDQFIFETIVDEMIMNPTVSNKINLKLSELGLKALEWYENQQT